MKSCGSEAWKVTLKEEEFRSSTAGTWVVHSPWSESSIPKLGISNPSVSVTRYYVSAAIKGKGWAKKIETEKKNWKKPINHTEKNQTDEKTEKNH